MFCNFVFIQKFSCNISAIFGNYIQVSMLFCVVWQLLISWMYYGIWDLDFVGTMCTNCQLPKFQNFRSYNIRWKNQGSKAIKVEHLLHFKALFRFSFPLCNLLKASSCQHPLFESSLCYDCVLEFLHFAFIMMFS